MNEQLFQGVILGVNGLVGVGMLWLNSKFDTVTEKIERNREVSDLKHKTNEDKISRIEKHCNICENCSSLH